jgi:hypothetical protein
MSDMSPLSRVKRKSDFGAVTPSGHRSRLIQFAKLQFVLGRPTWGSSGIDLSQRDRPSLLKLCSAAPEAVALSLVSNSSLVEGTL